MDQYDGSPGRSTCCFAELAASFINFLHYCSPSSGFCGAGKALYGTENIVANEGKCPLDVVLSEYTV